MAINWTISNKIGESNVYYFDIGLNVNKSVAKTSP